MKFKIIFLMPLIMLASCHLLRKNRLTQQSLSERTEWNILESRKTNRQQYHLLFQDSSQSDFSIVLVPKGKFTLNTKTGFEGEAEKVLIKAKHSSKNLISTTASKRIDSSILRVNKTEENQMVKVNEVNKFKTGFSWVWLLLLPMFYIIYFIFKKINIR